jgi:hypothetical protein
MAVSSPPPDPAQPNSSDLQQPKTLDSYGTLVDDGPYRSAPPKPPEAAPPGNVARMSEPL